MSNIKVTEEVLQGIIAIGSCLEELHVGGLERGLYLNDIHSHCTNLKFLRFSAYQLPMREISRLSNFKSLEALSIFSLKGTEMELSAFWKVVSSDLPNLISLSIVSDSLVYKTSQYTLPRLKVLEILG